jgi:HlyD family secretion protein
MPLTREFSAQHSEEVNEIIAAVPSWILSRGIIIILAVLISLLLLSSLIHYPEIIKTTLKVNSLNAPKEIITHQGGKLIKILIEDNQKVTAGQPLAFLESTAKHNDVLTLLASLKSLYSAVNNNQSGSKVILRSKNWNLGELQANYQIFYQDYILFSNTQTGGFYLAQKVFLEKDIQKIRKLEHQILQQKKVKEKEFSNLQEEYEAYQKLKIKKVISNSEFKQQENKFLSGKYPLQQTETDLLNNSSNLLAKQKELATLENTITEQKIKFLQALGSIISETESWILKYVISAPMNGRANYVGILQENQNVAVNQPLFIIDPGYNIFFGEVQIPQYNMGKVRIGQRALVKLRSYPFEEFGIINGKVSFIADFALKDSAFLAKIDFEKNKMKYPKQPIELKPGMVADIEIIIRESSLLQRFMRSLTKIFDNS